MTCKSGPLPRTRAELELYSRLALQKEIRLVPARRRSIHDSVSSRPSPDRHHPLTETALTRHGMRVNEPVADPDEKIVQYRCEDTCSWGDFKRLSLIVTFYRAAQARIRSGLSIGNLVLLPSLSGIHHLRNTTNERRMNFFES